MEDKPTIKAVFFDMDGVLYDSMGHHAHSWGKAFEEAGLFYSQADTYQNEGRTSTGTIQLTFKKHLNRDATPHEVEAIYKRKTQLVADLPPAEIMPGMQAFISFLKNRGIEIFVVTGSKQPSLLARLESDFGVNPAHIVSGRDVTHEKPHPEPYLKALAKSGVCNHQAMVVENAPLGVQSGKSANLFTLAVNTGPLPDAALWDSGANLVLGKTLDLQESWDVIAAKFLEYWSTVTP